jgi:hypothetical protein
MQALPDNQNPFVFFRREKIEKISMVYDDSGNPTTELQPTGEMIDALFMTVEIPGDLGKYNRVDRQVIEGGPECRKFAQQYQAFLDGDKENGIDISEIRKLGLVDTTAVEYLRKRGVRTLEQFGALPRISLMSLLPSNGDALQTNVKAFLKNQKDSESNQRIAEMQKQIEALQNLLTAKTEEPTARRRKQEAIENV